MVARHDMPTSGDVSWAARLASEPISVGCQVLRARVVSPVRGHPWRCLHPARADRPEFARRTVTTSRKCTPSDSTASLRRPCSGPPVMAAAAARPRQLTTAPSRPSPTYGTFPSLRCSGTSTRALSCQASRPTTTSSSRSAADALWRRRRNEPDLLGEVERLCWLDIGLVQARPDAASDVIDGNDGSTRSPASRLLIQLYEEQRRSERRTEGCRDCRCYGQCEDAWQRLLWKTGRERDRTGAGPDRGPAAAPERRAADRGVLVRPDQRLGLPVRRSRTGRSPAAGSTSTAGGTTGASAASTSCGLMRPTGSPTTWPTSTGSTGPG